MTTEYDLLKRDLSREAKGRLNQTQAKYYPGLPEDLDHSLGEGDAKTGPPAKSSPRKEDRKR